nr:hypothetical protein HmN_000934800 [Hymenolepis microstoma]
MRNLALAIEIASTSRVSRDVKIDGLVLLVGKIFALCAERLAFAANSALSCERSIKVRNYTVSSGTSAAAFFFDTYILLELGL